jgi:dihydrofolate synthase / folylpolyglutamate synthase
MGLLYFARQQVEVAVVEVGLGGRLDATNIVSPLVSVITSLSFDHTAWLGNTLAQIAAEKAGIIKPGRPVVSAPQAPEALKVIERYCNDLGSPLTLVGRDWTFEPGEISLEGQNFLVVPAGQPRFRRSRERLPFFVKLLGQHQLVNATVALAALAQVEHGNLEISPKHMREGLASVQWPGRLEVFSADPLVVCDGAHNGDSARRLVAALNEWFPGKRWTLIFGASSDKDFAAMFDALVPFAEQIVLTHSHHPRAADIDKLAGLVRERGGEVQTAVDVAEALETAVSHADSETGVIAAGSLFVAAEARAAWARRSGGVLPESDAD